MRKTTEVFKKIFCQWCLGAITGYSFAVWRRENPLVMRNQELFDASWKNGRILKKLCLKIFESNALISQKLINFGTKKICQCRKMHQLTQTLILLHSQNVSLEDIDRKVRVPMVSKMACYSGHFPSAILDSPALLISETDVRKRFWRLKSDVTKWNEDIVFMICTTGESS